MEKIAGLEEKLLSQVGKKVLLKAVVQGILMLAMSCFRLPVGLCNDIKMLLRKFWWGEWGDCRKFHLKNWESLYLPKLASGIGFKDLSKFNEAMSVKQMWCLVHETNSLC